MKLFSRDDDQTIKEEFIYPYKITQFDEEYFRSIFSSFRLRNDRYAALRLSLQTSYGWKQTIGTAHLVQQFVQEPKGLLAKFYVGKIFRRGGYEEKALIQILKFAFEVMELQKLIIFLNE